ncbi:MAG: metal ABC transporter permease [Pirellulales bacterium]|nr:metal ABC transporter permease [Pirellulales bacterium]
MSRTQFFVAVSCTLAIVLVLGVWQFIMPSESDSGRPTWDEWTRLLLLKDYNTRVVTLGASLLGCAGGIVGSFTLLRKRALMGDALSHATLPGIALAFMAANALGMSGKSLPVLLLGAVATGLLGVAAILLIRNLTRLKEDTALGAVLSVFFGAGVSLLGMIQQMETAAAAGLKGFIDGKTASMGMQDTTLITVTAIICIGCCVAFYKHFKLLCFDEAFAAAQGFRVVVLDIALMALVVAVCIVGLQAVGLILMIALLVIPAAAARFWTQRMSRMVVIAAVLGAVGGMAGAGASALFSKLPSGPMIVLVYAGFFVISMVFGPQRGLLLRWRRRVRLNRSIDRQHLLRAIYEVLDLSGQRSTKDAPPFATVAQLLRRRSWSPWRLKLAIARACRAGDVQQIKERVELTESGLAEAARLTRQHRLWELYLINYAEIAPSRVDQDADAIEHVLEPQIVARLESLLASSQSEFPESPHELAPAENAFLTRAAHGA